MSLSDKARAAREHAHSCANPSCHRVALALESAVYAEVLEQMRELAPEPDLEGIPPPAEAGFVSVVRIRRPSAED